jgi:hypothetical protein
MFQFNINKPEDISDPKVKLTIEYGDGEQVVIQVMNIFGGIIADYKKDSPFTCVVPVVVGNLTPGMIFSYISGLLTCATSILKDTEIPKELLQDMAYMAIEEGLSSKVHTCKK